MNNVWVHSRVSDPGRVQSDPDLSLDKQKAQSRSDRPEKLGPNATVENKPDLLPYQTLMKLNLFFQYKVN